MDLRLRYLTLQGVPNGLLVNDIDTLNSAHDGLWKVSYVHEETPHALSDVVFARRVDAERAKVAMEPLVDWTLSPPQVVLQLRENGWTRGALLQLMAEAIQW